MELLAWLTSTISCLHLDLCFVILHWIHSIIKYHQLLSASNFLNVGCTALCWIILGKRYCGTCVHTPRSILILLLDQPTATTYNNIAFCPKRVGVGQQQKSKYILFCNFFHVCIDFLYASVVENNLHFSICSLPNLWWQASTFKKKCSGCTAKC